MTRRIRIFASKDELIEQTLTLILDSAHTAIKQNGQFTIALAGGNTPKPLYEKIAKTNQDWSKWHIFWGDERFVPADHPDSNENMARQAWLNHVSIPPENIHPLITTADTADAAAMENEEAFKTFWKLTPEEWPSLDFILLGMGDDGHTASLFPGTQAMQVCDRLITVGNKQDSLRLTLTIPVINHAKQVGLLIAGAGKNKLLQEILSSPSRAPKYPVELIHPQNVIHWMLDNDSGQGINPSDS